ncbi:MAG TPA: signal peptidase II [Gemmatimonadaceae bacterium]|nr:signal peptidase II [Gemmatimonadaceae bacterium]
MTARPRPDDVVPAPATAASAPKARLFWGAFAVILVLDLITKYLAQRHLVERVPVEVIGDVARLTLAYNPGAAFSMHVGAWSRVFFSAVAIVVLFVLSRVYRDTQPADRLRGLALGMVCAGAIGNLIDRIRSPRGVIDFIDLGIGSYRWYTFNVADIGVSIGAILLAWSLWREERKGQG